MQITKNDWTSHVAAIKTQEGSTAAYARQHGLSRSALYYWQRKLWSATTAGTIVEPMTAARRPSKFIALRVGDPIHHVARSQTPCTLVLSGGMRLEMATLPDPQWLAAVGRSAQGAY